VEDRQRLLKSLPEENQNVIVRLFELVYTLSKHSAVTKMDLNNLAMVRFPARTHAHTHATPPHTHATPPHTYYCSLAELVVVRRCSRHASCAARRWTRWW
jgi:hypothetical protein